LEEHTPENIGGVIDYAVSHATDFHQFMLYTANPGTPLHAELKEKEQLKPFTEFDPADAHGQYRFNHRHPHIKDHQEEQFLISAFKRDFQENGPSLFRLIKTFLHGWQRYKNHADERIRARYDREVDPLRTTYASAVWAMKKWYKNDPMFGIKAADLLDKLYEEFGWKTRLYAALGGPVVFMKMKREEKRLANGLTMEPETFNQSNTNSVALPKREEQVDLRMVKFPADVAA